MRLYVRLLVMMFCGLPVLADNAEIGALAASPYELAKFVETHANFDWKPLWRALNMKDEELFLPVCDEAFRGVPACSSEIINVADRRQLILVLEHRSSQFAVFLRYRSVGTDVWQFSGAYQPFVKYFPPEHRLTRFGAKPFLVVTGQGNAGTGVSSKIESWMDLTREGLAPVLAFTSEGHYSPLPEGIWRSSGGSVVAMDTEPVERITVAFHIEFEAVISADERLRIGERRDRIVYDRARDGTFKANRQLSTATEEQVADFYEDFEYDDFSDTEFLNFNLKGLSALAKNGDTKSPYSKSS
jgi:hypothetical protein